MLGGAIKSAPLSLPHIAPLLQACDPATSRPSAGVVLSGPSIHPVQLPAAFIKGLSKADRRRLRIFMYLTLRFQSRRIDPRLDERTCAKAGVSQRQLRRMMSCLSRHEEGSHLGNLLVDAGRMDWSGVRVDDAYVAMAKERGGYMLAGPKVIASRVRVFFGGRAPKARCTMRLPLKASMKDIDKWMMLKLFEHRIDQTIAAKQKRHDEGGASVVVGEHASNVGKAKCYDQHEALTLLGSGATMHDAPMPSKATAQWMGVGYGRFWRLVGQFEKEGHISRTRRRLRLSEPVEDVAAFHEKWGMMPFRVGGLWYAQASNLYSRTTDYRGPCALLRRDLKGYGWKVGDMLAKARQQRIVT